MINIAIGIVVSIFTYTRSCAPDCPLKWNQITLSNGKIIHMHHWLLSSLLMPFTTNHFIRGILIGGIIHGIFAYDDWYIIYK